MKMTKPATRITVMSDGNEGLGILTGGLAGQEMVIFVTRLTPVFHAYRVYSQ
jgi:hypothetical protein